MIGPLLYDCNVSCEVVPMNAPKLFGVPRKPAAHRYSVVSFAAFPGPQVIVPFALTMNRGDVSPLTLAWYALYPAPPMFTALNPITACIAPSVLRVFAAERYR